MKLYVRVTDGLIMDASNVGAWEPTAETEIVEVKGCAERFDWPNGYPSRCLWKGGKIVANPAYDDLSAKVREERKANLANSEECQREGAERKALEDQRAHERREVRIRAEISKRMGDQSAPEPEDGALQ